MLVLGKGESSRRDKRRGDGGGRVENEGEMRRGWGGDEQQHNLAGERQGAGEEGKDKIKII